MLFRSVAQPVHVDRHVVGVGQIHVAELPAPHDIRLVVARFRMHLLRERLIVGADQTDEFRIRSGQRFVRRVVTEDDARVELANEPYKLELIGLKGGSAAEDESVEVGGAELTIYDNVEAKSGATCWGDLCRGPHVPDTRFIPPNAFRLIDRKSTRLNSSHIQKSRMPSSA